MPDTEPQPGTAPLPVEAPVAPGADEEVPDWMRSFNPEDAGLPPLSPQPARPDMEAAGENGLPDWFRVPTVPAPDAGKQVIEGTVVAPSGDGGNGGEPPEAPPPEAAEAVADIVPVGVREVKARAAPEPLTSDELRRRNERVIGNLRRVKDRINSLGAKGDALGERIAQAAVRAAAKDKGNLGEWARQQIASGVTTPEALSEALAGTPVAEAVRERGVGLRERARRIRDGVNNLGQKINRGAETRLGNFLDRVASVTAGKRPVAVETPAEMPEEQAVVDEAAKQQALEETRLAGEQRQDEGVEAYKAQVAAEAEAAKLAEEQKAAGERRAEAEKATAEQAQREAGGAARIEEMRQQAEARRQRYEVLKTKALDDNQVELLVRGVVGRDADGQRSAGGMIEDAAEVINNELAAAQQKELAVREGINQAQELMRQRETELQQQKAVKLEELKANAEDRLQLPGMRAELGRVATSLEEVNAELNRYLEMPARLQKTYAGEIARLRAERAGFTAKKNGLSRTVTQLEAKAAKFVEAQTPEVETWYQTQLLQAGREVQTLVDQQEGYDRADVEAWVRMELDTTIHEAGVALDNLERWQRLAADPESIAKQIAEVQAQQDMLVGGVENRIIGLNDDIARFTENLAEAKEIQKRAKTDKAKERAKIEVKRAEVALADAQAELDKANKELKRAKKSRKTAVDAKRGELLPAELLEEEGVNYGGEMAVTSYEGETSLVPLVDVVKGNRGRRKEAPRTEAATPVGRLAEYVIWGGEAMEPDENGNLVPVKVKGLYEREAMKFAGRLEAETELARQRLEQQASGEAKEVEDVNVEIGKALEQAGEGAKKAVELVIKASGENQLENISPENKRRLGEMIGSINTEMVNQAVSLATEAMDRKTPEVQQKISNWVGAMEMILDNAPAEAGNLAGLRNLVETLKKFTQ